MRALYRGVRIAAYALAFICVTGWIKLRCRNNSVALLQKLAVKTHIYCRKTIELFNIQVDAEHAERLKAPYLAVCNHLSYIDIIAIASVSPTQFVSHRGVQKSPLVGSIAASGGTLFVDKSSPSGLTRDIYDLSEMLEKGICLTIFPEGGTGSGEAVRYFHPALIEAAVRANVPVIPMRIQYTSLNGEPVTKANKDLIYIYGDKPFLPHIFKVVAKAARMEVSLRVFDGIPPAGLNRKQIAEKTHDIIADNFRTF